MRLPRMLVSTGVGLAVVLGATNLGGCPGIIPGGGSGTVFNLPPVVILTLDVDRGIAPLTVSFNSSNSTDDGIIVGRLWNFGDGQTSQEISPTHVFNAPGEYNVRLTLTDDLGATTTRTRTINVTLAPNARIAVDRTSAPSAPAVFNFDGSQSTDPDGQIVRFAWNFGDGSGEVDPIVPHTFGRPGTYRVTLTVTDNTGVTSTAEVIIEVGIRKPTLAFRVPPSEVTNIVATQNSPLWTYAVSNVEPGVPSTIRAGIDSDRDVCDANATIFSKESGIQAQMLVGHSQPVTCVAFSPTGGRLVTGSEDRTARVFDIETGLSLLTLGGHTDAIRAVAWSADGTRIVTAGDDGTAIVHNASSGDDVLTITAHNDIGGVALTEDGTRLVTGSNIVNDPTATPDQQPLVQLWSTFDGTLITEFAGHSARVTSVAVSPDGTWVVTGSVDQTARLWDANSGTEIFQFAGHTNTVTSVAYSDTLRGTRVLTGSSDLTARLWDATTGAQIRTFEGHTARITSVAFSADGLEIITGSEDGTTRLWNAETGAQIRRMSSCTSTVSGVGASSDGTLIASGVAAKNSKQLDRADEPNGDDLNIGMPVPLSLAGVAPNQTYFLWAEIDTDRTEPVRVYSPVQINVLPPFTSIIEAETPIVPFDDAGNASIVVGSTAGRQIFGLGELLRGDRIDLSELELPGYFSSHSPRGPYSILIVDDSVDPNDATAIQPQMFAWYQDGFVLFDRNTNLVVGHDANYYVVIDGFTGTFEDSIGRSINVHIERDAGYAPRRQQIYLNYVAVNQVSVADLPVFQVSPFAATDVGGGFSASDTAVMKQAIVDELRSIFVNSNGAPLDIEFVTSDDGDPPSPNAHVVYFEGAPPPPNLLNARQTQLINFFRFSIADFIDPRNDRQTGSVVVFSDNFATSFGGTAEQVGRALGRAAAHGIGNLLGLRNVNVEADVMGPTSGLGGARSLLNSPLRAQEQYNGQFGNQNAPAYLEEILGLAP